MEELPPCFSAGRQSVSRSQRTCGGYVACQVLRDVHKQLCNLMGTYLPFLTDWRVVGKLVEEALKARKNAEERTRKMAVNRLLLKLRSRGVEEEKGTKEMEDGGWSEVGDVVRDEAKEILCETEHPSCCVRAQCTPTGPYSVAPFPNAILRVSSPRTPCVLTMLFADPV